MPICVGPAWLGAPYSLGTVIKFDIQILINLPRGDVVECALVETRLNGWWRWSTLCNLALCRFRGQTRLGQRVGRS